MRNDLLSDSPGDKIIQRSIAWLHVGDLHLEEGDGWESLARLKQIVAEANTHLSSLDFVFLPGDNANNADPAEYAAMIRALAPLRLPWRAIPGDHDFETRTLDAYRDSVPPGCRPDSEIIAGHRCIFLDIVSAGSGGPDFRLIMHDRNRLTRELALAHAAGQIPLVFMHAYPGDLAADGPAIARILADGGARFVDTGHTHYNELLNDGRVIYGATRSTGQIEEAGGEAGYTLVCVHEGVPSWRFRPLGAPWPALQIVSPADLRMVTRVTDPAEVPRPGPVVVVARAFGTLEQPVRILVDGEDRGEMTDDGRGFWSATIELPDAGVHRVQIASGGSTDEISVLVRAAGSVPKRGLPVALGEPCHAIGAWSQAGITGLRLGPNSNGQDW